MSVEASYRQGFADALTAAQDAIAAIEGDVFIFPDINRPNRYVDDIALRRSFVIAAIDVLRGES